MDNEHDIVDRLRSVGGYFDAAALKYVSCSEAADEIERLRNALLRIECEPINAEYLARAALDGPNAELGVFVTAKIVGANDCRQGAVISIDPLRIRGQSGAEYDCEGEPTVVENPPEKCIGCDMPLGRMCGRCAANLDALGSALDAAGIALTPNA